MSTKPTLNVKQQLFADEYLKDLNATRAYKRAGYTAEGKSAEVVACQLLGNPRVAEYIQKAMDERSIRVKRSADDVLRDIEAVKADATQQVTDHHGNLVMLDRGAALRALELEGKHYKMFTDKVETETTGKDGGPIDVNHTLTFVKPK